MKRLFFLFTIITLSLSVPQYTYSQNNSGRLDLTINPPVMDLTAKPGDKLDELIRVRNNTSQAIPLTITAKKLTSSSINGQPIPAEPTPEDTYISWVKFDPSNFTAQPQEWIDIKVTISVPKDAAYGYYYVFEISPKYDSSFNGTGAKVNGKVLIAALLNVKKAGAISQAALVNFSPVMFINEYLPIQFNVKVANKGNVHIRPIGNIFIRSIGDNDLAVLDVNRTQGAILPEGTRTYPVSWNDGFIVKEPIIIDGLPQYDKQGKPATKLTFNWDKLTSFRIGKYTASLLLVYDAGNHDETLDATTTFWIVPYTIIASTIISILLLFILFRLLIRSYIKRELRRQQT